MIKRWILVIIGIMGIVAVLSFVGNANAKTIYVGPGEEYTSIQDAIDNATDGDTIIVRDGIYYENIKVTKERLTIKSENGSDNCIIDGGDRNRGNVITLKADGITIEGFTIRNSGWHSWNAGIKVLSNFANIRYNKVLNNGVGIYIGGHRKSDNNNITYNDIRSNWRGIYIDSPNDLHLSSNNRIAYNNISYNIWEGINVYGYNATITCNRISNNGEYGMLLSYSKRTIVTNNKIYNDGIFMEGRYSHIIENNTVNDKPLYYFKGWNGGKVPEDAGQVILLDCSNMIIENLSIDNTDTAIEIISSSHITIRNSTISNNKKHGIFGIYSDNVIITHNNISNNSGCGIKLYLCDNGNITHDNISSNKGHGILIEEAGGNMIAYNFISSNDRKGIRFDGGYRNKIVYNKILENDEIGVHLEYSYKNEITYNVISNNGCGVYLDDAGNNHIERNNFINNGLQATFYSPHPNYWYRNYWSNWRIILPKPIFGWKILVEPSEMGVFSIEIPWLNFDWLPAMRPYSIDY